MIKAQRNVCMLHVPVINIDPRTRDPFWNWSSKGWLLIVLYTQMAHLHQTPSVESCLIDFLMRSSHSMVLMVRPEQKAECHCVSWDMIMLQFALSLGLLQRKIKVLRSVFWIRMLSEHNTSLTLAKFCGKLVLLWCSTVCEKTHKGIKGLFEKIHTGIKVSFERWTKHTLGQTCKKSLCISYGQR